MREMKYHIYNRCHEPLCIENDEGVNCVIDFDSFTQAVGFIKFIDKFIMKDFFEDVEVIVEDILYYDGYISAMEATKVLLKLAEEEENR